MKKHYKPFRLINKSELASILQRLANALHTWNELHALFALTSSLQERPMPQPDIVGYCFSNAYAQPLAYVAQTELSLIKQAAVGDTSACFDQLAWSLLDNLLQSILGVATLSKMQTPLTADDWFYRGAPTLVWSLQLANEELTVFLHPNWVLQQLEKTKPTKTKLSLVSALAPQLLQGQVALKPFHLQVKELIALRIGDVINTEHPVTQGLELSHKNQSICEVHIGANNQYKTIQIKSSQ